MLWKTRHFSRNQKISEKAVKQVQHERLVDYKNEKMLYIWDF